MHLTYPILLLFCSMHTAHLFLQIFVGEAGIPLSADNRTPEERNQTPLYNAAPHNDSRPVPATTDLQGKTSCLAGIWIKFYACF